MVYNSLRSLKYHFSVKFHQFLSVFLLYFQQVSSCRFKLFYTLFWRVIKLSMFFRCLVYSYAVKRSFHIACIAWHVLRYHTSWQIAISILWFYDVLWKLYKNYGVLLCILSHTVVCCQTWDFKAYACNTF